MRTAPSWWSRESWSRRWRKVSGPRGRDVVIIALSAVYSAFSVTTDSLSFGAGNSRLLVGALGLLGSVALVWRRRFPVRTTAVGIVVLLFTGNVFPVGFGLMRIAIVRRDRLLVAATAGVALTSAVPVIGSDQSFGWNQLLGGAIGALFFAMWGAYVGARRDLITSLEGRANRAEAERELKAEQARLAERSRIAREMHDVLAHKVSLIALQAGGLEVNPGADPEIVERTAALIRTTARQALEDLRGVLGVLRSDENPDDLAPQPDLADLAQLVESSRAAGVQVKLNVELDQTPPAQIGRTIYRIVQESLTNVHKHARGAATTVTVRREGGANEHRGIETVVTNRRPVASGSLLPGSGSGLIGLRERLLVLGGTLECGPTDDGGWSVRAVIPAGVAAAALTSAERA